MAGTYQIAITVGIDTKYTDFLVKERSAFNLETTGKMQIGKGTGVDNQITLTANGYNGANLLNISTSNLTLKNGTGTDASAYVSIVLAPPTNDQAMFTLTLTNNALPDTITAELNYENFTSITTFVIQKVDATKFYNFEIQSNNLQVDNVDSTAVIKITAVNDAPISEMSFSVSTALISGQFSDATDQNVILTLTETTSLVSNDPIHITIIGSDNTELEFDLSIAPARKLQAIVQTNSLQVGNTTSDATVKVQTINYLTTTTINNFTITGATGLTTQMTVSGDYFLLTLGATSSNLTAGNKTITISDNRQSNISTTCLLDVAPFDTTPIIGRNYIDGHQTIDGSHVYTNATSGGVWSATGTGNGVTFTNGTLN
jgi:hypothetical protein